MTHGFEELNEARELLHTTRTAARKAARDLEIELTRAAQSAVDEAAYSAVANGATKTSVAAYLGESRTTLNQRLARASGQVHDPVIEVVVPQVEVGNFEAENGDPVYKILPAEDGIGKLLRVKWDSYGPDYITGFGIFEIIHDPDEEIYWFALEQGEDDSVRLRLDTVFSGWYYNDAQAFVKNAIEGETDG